MVSLQQSTIIYIHITLVCNSYYLFNIFYQITLIKTFKNDILNDLFERRNFYLS